MLELENGIPFLAIGYDYSNIIVATMDTFRVDFIATVSLKIVMLGDKLNTKHVACFVGRNKESTEVRSNGNYSI